MADDEALARSLQGQEHTRSFPSHCKPASGIPLGAFGGRRLFLNRVADEVIRETPLASGRLELADLIPPECECALATTFCLDPSWVASKLQAVSSVLVVTSDPRSPPLEKPRLLGDAEVVDARRLGATPRADWHWLLVRPSAQGIVHAKLLLFRTRLGLRVALTGCNLMGAAQWESMRDAIWVQDFEVDPRSSSPPSTAAAAGGDFGGRLRAFVDRLTATRETERDRSAVLRLTSRLFDGICFATAAASLVESMPVAGAAPAGGKLPTGWRRLALAVRERLGCLAGSAHHHQGALSSPTVWMQAGSFGDLKAPFVRMMEQAMLGEIDGRTTKYERDATWAAVRRTRCLWLSRRTAASMRFPSLSNLRFMPMAKYAEIPAEVRDRLFYDAAPATFRGASPSAVPPISHAKVTLVTQGDCPSTRGVAPGVQGTLYVGSHNLSVAAWGEGGSQPKNVELGVVLATDDHATAQAWREMLPSCLPPEAELTRTCAERGFVPAQEPTWLRQRRESATSEREVRECQEELRQHLLGRGTAAGDRTAPTSSCAPPPAATRPEHQHVRGPPVPAVEVIDLSSDDESSDAREHH